MNDTKGSNLIFLLCVPRSGSSLTNYMLQNHSHLFATQEMWFLMSLYDLRSPAKQAYGGTPILSRFFNGMLTDDMFVRACRAFASSIYHDFMQASGSRYIIDKSPRYYYLLEFLDQLFPHSKRIMLVRNPLDIAASYKKVHADSRNPHWIEELLYDASFDVKAADLTVGLFRYAEYFADSHPLTYRVSYERLVANPREQLSKLCSFIGVPYEEGMEQYGSYKLTNKSDLFFSMGVGDPGVAVNEAPHTRSVGTWLEVLSKREVESLCRALGAQYFYDHGYSAQLEAAERFTGVRFERSPDLELIERRRKQFIELTGCKWTPHYRMSAGDEVTGSGGLAFSAADLPEAGKLCIAGDRSQERSVEESRADDRLQLEITLRAAEHRLQHAYVERDRVLEQYRQLQAKVERVKAWIPFSRSLSKWTSARLGEGGKET